MIQTTSKNTAARIVTDDLVALLKVCRPSRDPRHPAPNEPQHPTRHQRRKNLTGDRGPDRGHRTRTAPPEFNVASFYDDEQPATARPTPPIFQTDRQRMEAAWRAAEGEQLQSADYGEESQVL